MPFKSKKIEQHQQEENKDDVTSETTEENQQQEIKYITTFKCSYKVFER